MLSEKETETIKLLSAFFQASQSMVLQEATRLSIEYRKAAENGQKLATINVPRKTFEAMSIDEANFADESEIGMAILGFYTSRKHRDANTKLVCLSADEKRYREIPVFPNL